MAVRVSMVRLLLFALPNLQGSSTEEWSLIVALCRPRQGLTWQHSAQSILSLVRRFSQTPFSQEGDLVRWAPRSRFLHAHVRCAVMAPSPKAPVLPVWQVHLLNGHTSFVFEHRLSAGTRVTSHHGILHDFHHQLLHPAPLMNSPSSSTCSHLLLVTSSHLDFPGGVMNRLSSPVGVLAP